MVRPMLPPYFQTNPKGLEVIRQVQNAFEMEQDLLNHFRRRSDFLTSVTTPDGWTQEEERDFLFLTLLTPDETAWAELTVHQKNWVKARYLVLDPGTLTVEYPGVKKIESISSSFITTEHCTTLQQYADYDINTVGVIEFGTTDLMGENWEQSQEALTVIGSRKPWVVPALRVVARNVTLNNDWYYRRMGVLLGLLEHTSPNKVVALWRLVMDGPKPDTITSMLAAFTDHPIALKQEEVVSSEYDEEEEKWKIVTTRNEYVTPEGSAPHVRYDKQLNPGDELFRFGYWVTYDTHGDWINGNTYGLLISGTTGLTEKLNQLLSRDFEFSDSYLPIRMEDPSEGKIVGFSHDPSNIAPVLHFKLGDDADPTLDEGITTAVLYNTLNIPVDQVEFYLAYAIGATDINVGGDTVPLDSQGIFVHPDTGISGRVLDTTAGFITTATAVTQARGSVKIMEDTTDSLVHAMVLRSDLKDSDVIPVEGDWMWLAKADVWHKTRIKRVVVPWDNPDEIELFAHPFWVDPEFDEEDEPEALIFTSYDGKPYTGADAARINTFNELLTWVSRHVAILVINPEWTTEEEIEALLAYHRRFMNVWTAIIVVAAPDYTGLVTDLTKEEEYGF